MSTQLATGLGGAIGCDYLRSRNRLFFVEYNGKISRVDLVRAFDYTVFDGTATIPANSNLDFVTGAVTPGGGGHIHWGQDASGNRALWPKGGYMIANIGVVGFNSVSSAELQYLSYSSDPLDGGPGPTNQLVAGDVFALKSIAQPGTNFDYVKAQILSYGADITVRWKTYRLRPHYRVLGTGYDRPEDIVLSTDEQHAYVTERGGNLLRVDLSNANRVHATVVSSGMIAPHQIALDEDHSHAYVVEYAYPGRLLRVDLTTGAHTVLVSDLEGGIGLLVTDDLRYAYVSEQPSGGSGRLSRIDLGTGLREELTTSLANPFFLTWADEGENTVLVTERDPNNRVTSIDLTESPVSVSHVATGVPARPSSVAKVDLSRLLICSDSVISLQDLTGYTATQPTLLGIGHIPADHIVGGYADTTKDPVTGTPEDYFFKVQEAPFGGTLSLMINHERAFADGAAYYKVFVDGAVQQKSWNDYLWVGNRFRLTSRNPIGSGFFRVRRPNELWYNHWLGYRLNTTGLTNGLHTITVKLYSTASDSSFMSDDDVQVQIDNRRPTAKIGAIMHDGAPVAVCEIVDSGSDEFTFHITAYDHEGHLKGWRMKALWGDNKSKIIDTFNYTPPGPCYGIQETDPAIPSPAWHAAVASDIAAGDLTSLRCAHTFYLTVWDRATNGYNRTIHWSHYHKSITIMLPPP